MKQFVLGILIVSIFIICPSYSKATTMPCSMILEPNDKKLTNAKGTALIYKVQLRPPSFARTNISILGVHLPEPSSYGNYDSPTWAGRFDEITAKMKNVEVQVRLSNSKTEKLGPSILRSNIKYCK